MKRYFIIGALALAAATTFAAAGLDGYTLGVGFNGPIAFAPFMYKKMPYGPAKDLLPDVLTTSQPNVLAVSASNPAKTLPEFIAWAKTQGDRLSYASVGKGSSSHLSMELFLAEAGLEEVHVPYAGSPPAATSVAAGDTQMLFTVAPALLPLVDGGRIRLLAATSLIRADSLKDIPTIAEQGVPGFEALAWNGLFGSAGTPQVLFDRVNADVNAALADPGVRAAFVKQGLIVGGGTAAEFKAFIDQDRKKWGAIIEKAGITVDRPPARAATLDRRSTESLRRRSTARFAAP
jgi:tripartite-type tricarboxylate transporter receptor subunit TctC